jgi:hypothetical protein
MGEVLREGEKLLPETMHFYQRVVDHKPECLSPEVRLQVLERLDNLYRLFPKLQAEYPRLVDHPDFRPQYQALFKAFNPVQALLETCRKLPATIVVSQDAMEDGETAMAIIEHFASKYRLNLVLLATDESAKILLEKCGKTLFEKTIINPNPRRSDIEPQNQREKLESAQPLAVQFREALGVPGGRQIITFGLLANVLTGSIVEGYEEEWLLIAGREFDSLLGQLPKESVVTLAGLRFALKNCRRAVYVGNCPSHSFARLSREIYKPVEALAILSAGKQASQISGKYQVIRFLGVAANIPVETWRSIAEALQQVELTHKRKAILRILAWGADIERLRDGLKDKNNIEVLAVFERPRDFSVLADVGLDLQSGADDTAGGLNMDFKLSGMAVIIASGSLPPAGAEQKDVDAYRDKLAEMFSYELRDKMKKV